MPNAKKTTKPTPLPITPEAIQKAAETNSIKALVGLADAFNRVALSGPFPIELPCFVSAFIGGQKNTYRKVNLKIGMTFDPLKIALGKKQGLIFSFKPMADFKREGEPVQHIEMTWDDVISFFGDLSDKIEERLNRDREHPIIVSEVNDQIKAVIDKNPSMHKILTEGFALAQIEAKQNAADDHLEEIEGFGTF